jgi:DNA (cytosine-5)-methyltransferase 1
MAMRRIRVYVAGADIAEGAPLLLSLFCGAGGLDLGFELAGFRIGLAFDRNAESIRSYNANRAAPAHGHVADVTKITLAELDKKFGKRFTPAGVIGGPPCQSFSQANVHQKNEDPRDRMPIIYAERVAELNARRPLDFL